MPANMENSAVTTGQEKVSFHSNPKEGQWHRIFILGKIESRRWRGWQRTRWFNDICDWSSDVCSSDLGRKVLTNQDSRLKNIDITLPTKVLLVKAMVFPVVMYGCDSLIYKESWAPKNWCFWTVVLVKTLESPLDCKEIQPVHPKGAKSWVFIVRTDVEAETPILWPPHAKNWLILKDSDAGKDWRQEKGTTEDEMVGWHQWLNGHEFEQAPGESEGQGILLCYSSSGCKELDMIRWLNNTNKASNLSSLFCK